MSNERKPSISQRTVVVLVVLAFIVVGGIGLYAIRTIRLQRRSTSPLVGTWRGETGNVLDFRPDGTARWRFGSGKVMTGFMEWTLDANELVCHQYSSRNSVRVWFARAQRATIGLTPTARYQVIEISPTQFKLLSVDGEVVTFTATRDREL